MLSHLCPFPAWPGLQRAHLSALVTPIVAGVQQRLQEKAAADAGAGIAPPGVTRQKLIWVNKTLID